MKKCGECGKDTPNRKFCSKTCSRRNIVKANQIFQHDDLYREYHVEKRTVVEIAVQHKVSVRTIYTYLNKLGIEQRDERFVDFSGVKLGQTTVLERLTPPQKGGGKHIRWLCRCGCGKEFHAFSHHLSRSTSVRCRGCSDKARRSQKELKNYIWNNLRNTAFRHGKEFLIEQDYAYNLFLKQNRTCLLSGVPIRFAACAADHVKGQTTASLDRIDSSKGYLKGNVRWLHKDINLMRSNRTDKQFVEWCIKVAHYDSNKQQ